MPGARAELLPFSFQKVDADLSRRVALFADGKPNEAILLHETINEELVERIAAANVLDRAVLVELTLLLAADRLPGPFDDEAGNFLPFELFDFSLFSRLTGDVLFHLDANPGHL